MTSASHMLLLLTSAQELVGKINFNKLYVLNINDRYGIAPKITEPGQKPRIEVFNPCDDSDDQKTSTCILFSDD